MNVEELYVSSIKKLKVVLPKLVLFLGMIYLVWNIAEYFLIPFVEGINIGEIEVKKVLSLFVIGIVIAFFLSSLYETKKFAESLAGILLFHLGEKSDGIRYRKIRNSLSFLLFSIPFLLFFLTTSNWLENLWPLSLIVFSTGISAWIIFSLFLFSLTITSEIRITEEKKKKK